MGLANLTEEFLVDLIQKSKDRFYWIVRGFRGRLEHFAQVELERGADDSQDLSKDLKDAAQLPDEDVYKLLKSNKKYLTEMETAPYFDPKQVVLLVVELRNQVRRETQRNREASTEVVEMLRLALEA